MNRCHRPEDAAPAWVPARRVRAAFSRLSGVSCLSGFCQFSRFSQVSQVSQVARSSQGSQVSQVSRLLPLFGLCGLLLAGALLIATPSLAQQDPAPTEAAFGGRQFPAQALRGRFLVTGWPEVQLDGKPERLAPGSRILNEQQMLVAPAALTGQTYLVNYTRDAAGLLREVWILTPDEARAKRASAEKPFLNFWPFVSGTGSGTIDPNTPYDQLPAYGQ